MIVTMGARGENDPPRATAYYYADLERLKRQEPIKSLAHHDTSTDASIKRPDDNARENSRPFGVQSLKHHRNQPIRAFENHSGSMKHPVSKDPMRYEDGSKPIRSQEVQSMRSEGKGFSNELSEYVDKEIVKEAPMREVPPLRDRDLPLRDLPLRDQNFHLPILHDQISPLVRDLQNLPKLRDLSVLHAHDFPNPLLRDHGLSREIPLLRERQWSLPEYHTPENSRMSPETFRKDHSNHLESSRKDQISHCPENFRKDYLESFRYPESSRKDTDLRKLDTYSTAGTFPMPEPKEKEPLLAELEVVGRVPLTQLGGEVRRSRSWYLCCPATEEPLSRESSWRYSSLRTVTQPPIPQTLPSLAVSRASDNASPLASLLAERDALARALTAERQRAFAAARAHDARLAELHGVIAELVRRRAGERQGAIPEEEGSDECESTTQPAGELDEADDSRTDQNEWSTPTSPAPPAPPVPPPPPRANDLTTDDDTSSPQHRRETRRPASPPTAEAEGEGEGEDCAGRVADDERDDTSPQGSDNDDIDAPVARMCLATRWSQSPRGVPPSPGRRSARQAKLASRVRLPRTVDAHPADDADDDEGWCLAAERLALNATDASVAGPFDGSNADGNGSYRATLAAWRARSARQEADAAVLRAALGAATDTAHRLSCALAVQESCCVALCRALAAADRGLEAYDVLLALAETEAREPPDAQRLAAESVARQLLSRLERESPTTGLGEPLLPPGPWLQPNIGSTSSPLPPWDSSAEQRLRRHAARLKASTAALREEAPTPRMYSCHDASDQDSRPDMPASPAKCESATASLEAAVALQERLQSAERRALRRARDEASTQPPRSPRSPRAPHWLDGASETDL